MPRDDGSLLEDMLVAAYDALQFSHELTLTEFKQSRLHQHAVLKAVEIIGEAAAQISNDTKMAHPNVPWRQIVGMRHRLVHGYFRVNLVRVWETVRTDLPKLVELIEPLVPRGSAQEYRPKGSS